MLLSYHRYIGCLRIRLRTSDTCSHFNMENDDWPWLTMMEWCILILDKPKYHSVAFVRPTLLFDT